MKLKEYMALCEPGTEITCWDKDVDSEFYFYAKEKGEKPDKEFPNVDKCEKMLAEHLDIVKIHDGGVEVNLYELLENPKIIEFAKKNMFEEHQYEDDSDVVMMLFDDNVKNFSMGYEGFSELMVQCLNESFGEEKVTENNGVDSPKMKYGDMIKFLNDNGILLMQPLIADCVDTLLPIGWTGTEEYYEEICEKCFDAYCDTRDTELDHWDIVKVVLEKEFNKEVSLDDVIKECAAQVKDVSGAKNKDVELEK